VTCIVAARVVKYDEKFYLRMFLNYNGKIRKYNEAWTNLT